MAVTTNCGCDSRRNPDCPTLWRLCVKANTNGSREDAGDGETETEGPAPAATLEETPQAASLQACEGSESADSGASAGESSSLTAAAEEQQGGLKPVTHIING